MIRSIIEAAVVLLVIFILLLILDFPHVHDHLKADRVSCMSHQRQLALAAIMWSNEHDGKLPAALGWAATIQPLIPEEIKYIFQCPTQQKKNSGEKSYGYNSAIGGKNIGAIKNPTTVIATADCLVTIPDQILRTPADFDPRHQGKIICSYLDGHVELMAAPLSIPGTAPSGSRRPPR